MGEGRPVKLEDQLRQFSALGVSEAEDQAPSFVFYQQSYPQRLPGPSQQLVWYR